ncbi:hypothetical protein LINGRAHAP2_LOCUS7491 [Linum grandiflorum]
MEAMLESFKYYDQVIIPPPDGEEFRSTRRPTRPGRKNPALLHNETNEKPAQIRRNHSPRQGQAVPGFHQRRRLVARSDEAVDRGGGGGGGSKQEEEIQFRPYVLSS